MKEKIAGWAFGIIASILSMIAFYHARLYAQSIISIYYALIGVYGWIYWKKSKQRNEHIRKWNLKFQFQLILLFSFITIPVAYLLSIFTDASQPLLDSFLTVFGILATIQEARKILSSWIYWFIINLLSCYLYATQGLTFYAILMVIYAIICIPGYLNWLKIYRQFQPDKISPI